MGKTEPEHWMLTGERGGRPLPEVVVRRWSWFRRRARSSRRNYVAAEVVSVVAAAAVPVFAALRWDVALSAIAGAVVLIATTVRTVLGFHDDWVEYVRLRFDLEREAGAFLYRIEPYDTEDTEAVRTLVIRNDDLAAASRSGWLNRRQQLAATPKPQPGKAP